MDYQKHYTLLMARAQARKLEQYYEKHHIIPRCLGGSDSADNLVNLTGREHFIAHQLLVKIYPKNHSLAKAANMMCVATSKMPRSQNRLYEWLRIRLREAQRICQTGEGNSNFGKIWICNDQLRLNKKIDKYQLGDYIEQGWKQGRSFKWGELKKVSCLTCKIEFDQQTKEKYCSTECRNKARVSVFDGREEELIRYYQKLGSLNKAIKAMGLPGAMGGWYQQAKKIIEMVR